MLKHWNFIALFWSFLAGDPITWVGTGHLKRGYGEDPLFMHLLPFASPPVEVQLRSQDPISKKNVKFFLQNQTF